MQIALGFVGWALRRRFQAIYLVGVIPEPIQVRKLALIGCANHTNWWDGFVVGTLTERCLGKEFYVAQEEKYLRRYWFFRLCGAFGVDLGDPRKTLSAMRHARSLLRSPAALVWFFPQGKLMAPDAPIQVRRGAAFLAASTGAPILPCGLRYEFRDQENPAVFLAMGPLLFPPLGEDRLQAELTRLVEEAKRYADPDVPLPDRCLLRPKRSMNEIFDAFVGGLRRKQT
jgi:chlorobactene lauroyltransferase